MPITTILVPLLILVLASLPSDTCALHVHVLTCVTIHVAALKLPDKPVGKAVSVTIQSSLLNLCSTVCSTGLLQLRTFWNMVITISGQEAVAISKPGRVFITEVSPFPFSSVEKCSLLFPVTPCLQHREKPRCALILSLSEHLSGATVPVSTKSAFQTVKAHIKKYLS